MRLHRIALASYSATPAEAFGGTGGLYAKGRWHTAGRPIVYAAECCSLAMAEALVHLQRSNNVAPYHHWEIIIPDALILPAPRLPEGWQDDASITQAVGDAWLASNRSVAIWVPSKIVSVERNCLINPKHPRFDLKWVCPGPKEFRFDARLTRP